MKGSRARLSLLIPFAVYAAAAAQRIGGRSDTPATAMSEAGSLQPKTITHLADLAGESFKRQADLDESVWRSLPFFAATIALAAALIGTAAKDVPPFSFTPFALVVHAFLVLGVASFGWALRWFWTVVRPRDYEYPSTDAAIRTYAEEVTAFHRSHGMMDAALDDIVVSDLQLFMAEQYGNAARTNFAHNAAKMKARSRVMLFMMIGFVLAFACEATIFVDRNFAADRSVVSRG